MLKKAAVFCCRGLGDGLISLMLSHNLQMNGYEVSTFHPFLEDLQDWFPTLPIKTIPDDASQIFHSVDKIFFFYEKSEHLQALLQSALRNYPDKTMVLNPIATSNQDYPFWSHGKFDGSISFVDNLYNFCKNILQLKVVERSNGIMAPFELKKRGFEKRVALHPTSSRLGKNWPKEKFVELAMRLKTQGFLPEFVLTSEEKRDFANYKDFIASVSSLSSIASFIYQSNYFIGNDSGLGHLASCLGVPTVTICRSQGSIKFWRPGWAKGVIVAPPLWIPNFKFLRIRDLYWKRLVTVDAVIKAFNSLL